MTYGVFWLFLKVFLNLKSFMCKWTVFFQLVATSFKYSVLCMCVSVLHLLSSWYAGVKDSTCPSTICVCSSHQWPRVVALKKVFRASLLNKMSHPYCKLLKPMTCWKTLHTRKAEYKHYIKTLASGILNHGTSSKDMHRIMKCIFY
jgi:hypothetical protein